MSLIALGPRVFVRPDPPPTESAGGIHLVSEPPALTGTVVALGDGPTFIAHTVDAVLTAITERMAVPYEVLAAVRATVAPGHHVALDDRVVFAPSAGFVFEFNTDTLIALDEDDILAIIEED